MSTDARKERITAIVSTRNEDKTIEEIVTQTIPYVDEVIVVDGHSTDRTRELAAHAGAQVILDNGNGKGEALRIGIQNARGGIIVFLDADGSHCPGDIPKILQPILDNRADLVIGSRGRGGSDELHGDLDGLVRMLGSDLILILINRRWKQHLTDCENGFRAIRTEVARAIGLKENIATIEQEMTIKCLKHGYRVCDIAVHEYARRYGKSTIALGKVWFRFIWTAIKYNFF